MAKKPILFIHYLNHSKSPKAWLISHEYILNHSLVTQRQLFNPSDLKTTSYLRCQLTLSHDCPITDKILFDADSDIYCALRMVDDGGHEYETDIGGFLGDSYSWGYDHNGNRCLNITIEDASNKLFTNSFSDRATLLHGKALSSSPYIDGVINKILKSESRRLHEDIEIKFDTPTDDIDEIVTAKIDVGKTNKEILDKLLYELGYSYYVVTHLDGNGLVPTFHYSFHVKKIGCSSTEGAEVLTKADIGPIDITKSIKQYRQANVTIDELEQREGEVIYKDITNADSTHDCKIEIQPQQSYPDENWSYVDINDISKGYEIVGLTSTPTFTPHTDIEATDLNAIEASLEGYGCDKIRVKVKNKNTSQKVTLTRLQSRADFLAIKSQGVVTQDNEASVNNPSSLINVKADYIHTIPQAKRLANLLTDYYHYCNLQYSFKTKRDLECGVVYKLVFDSKEIFLMPFSITTSEGWNTIKAVGMSVFDLDREPKRDISSDVVPNIGPAGPKGEDGVAMKWNIKTSADTFVINRRRDDSQILTFKADIEGYDTLTPQWSVSYGIKSEIESGIELTVPYDAETDTITIRMYADGVEDSIIIRAIDETVYHTFLGVYDSSSSITEKYVDGDFFVCNDNVDGFEKGNTYSYSDDNWVLTTDTSDLLTALHAMVNNETIDLEEISDPNTTAWFNTIVSKKIISEKIKASKGFFDGIEVTGTSQFNGQVNSGSSFSTHPAQGEVFDVTFSSDPTDTYSSHYQYSRYRYDRPTDTWYWDDWTQATGSGSESGYGMVRTYPISILDNFEEGKVYKCVNQTTIDMRYRTYGGSSSPDKVFTATLDSPIVVVRSGNTLSITKDGYKLALLSTEISDTIPNIPYDRYRPNDGWLIADMNGLFVDSHLIEEAVSDRDARAHLTPRVVTLHIDAVDAGITTGTVLPMNDNVSNIGQEGHKFANVYADKVWGAVFN